MPNFTKGQYRYMFLKLTLAKHNPLNNKFFWCVVPELSCSVVAFANCCPSEI